MLNCTNFKVWKDTIEIVLGYIAAEENANEAKIEK